MPNSPAHSRRGDGFWTELVYPLTQWELLAPTSGSVPDRMPLTQWDAFLPRASPPDPILRSGLPECGIRALSPVAGAREAQGWRDPCLLLHGTAVLSGPRSSLGATRVSVLESFLVPSFLPGKGSKTEDAPCRGWWTLGHTGLDALIRRGSLPLLKEKEFAKNRFKVNTSIEMVDGGHRNASMAARKIKILKQPTRNS